VSERRAPFIAIQTDIRKDERVNVIADVAGYSRHEAMGRLLDLWCWCADRKLEDAPADCEGYAVPDAVVRRFLGARGVEAILGDDCDELALGARRRDGLIFLRGTESTVRALRGWAKTAAAGGRARATTAGRSPGGQFVGLATNVQQDCQPETSCNPPDFDLDESRKSAIPNTCERSCADVDFAGAGDPVSKPTNVQQDLQLDASSSPVGDQPPASSQPAPASVDPRSKILFPESALPRARAIPTAEPTPVTPAAQEHAERRRQVIVGAWACAGREFVAVQAEGIDRTAPNMWAGLPAASSPPMVNLRAIVDELIVGDCPDYDGAAATIERRIRVAAAEARQLGTAEYMTPARMWNPESFSIASALIPEQVTRPRPRSRPAQRAPPRSHGPSIGRIEPEPPEKYASGDVKL
jgi:hypothetical protein